MIVIFWHICELSNWKSIVQEQFDVLHSSGLLDLCDSIQVGFLGTLSSIDWLVRLSNKINIIANSEYICNYERITINSMVDFAKAIDESAKILYIHSKGVTKHPNDKGIKLWREYMHYFLIERHTKIIPLLDSWDAVGCNAVNLGNLNQKIDCEKHCIHFSGNFWWARSDYIATLKKISEVPLDMKPKNLFFLNERWICHKIPHCKILEVHSTGRAHLYNATRQDLGDYKNKWNETEITSKSRFEKGGDEILVRRTLL